jgi:hypothetical protein
MLDRIADGLLAIINSVPALIVQQDSATFLVIRAMFTLLLVVLIVFVIAMLRPFWAAVARYVSKVSHLIVPKR